MFLWKQRDICKVGAQGMNETGGQLHPAHSQNAAKVITKCEVLWKQKEKE